MVTEDAIFKEKIFGPIVVRKWPKNDQNDQIWNFLSHRITAIDVCQKNVNGYDGARWSEFYLWSENQIGSLFTKLNHI